MLAGDGFEYEYHRRRPIIRKSFNKTRKSHENWFDERRKQQRETNSQPSRNIDVSNLLSVFFSRNSTLFCLYLVNDSFNK